MHDEGGTSLIAISSSFWGWIVSQHRAGIAAASDNPSDRIPLREIYKLPINLPLCKLNGDCSLCTGHVSHLIRHRRGSRLSAPNESESDFIERGLCNCAMNARCWGNFRFLMISALRMWFTRNRWLRLPFWRISRAHATKRRKTFPPQLESGSDFPDSIVRLERD